MLRMLDRDTASKTIRESVGVWTSGSILTNPTNGTLLADTGQLVRGWYLFAVSGAGSGSWIFDVQHRNAANTANNDSQRRRPAAGDEDWILANPIFVETNERLRIVLSGDMVGEVQMSIFHLEMRG